MVAGDQTVYLVMQRVLLVLGGSYSQNNGHAFCNYTEKQWNWQHRCKGLMLMSMYTEQLGSLKNKEKLPISMHHIVAKKDAVCQTAENNMFPNPAVYQDSRALLHNNSC